MIDSDKHIYISFALLAVFVLMGLAAYAVAAATTSGEIQFTQTEETMLKTWGVSVDDYRSFVSAKEIAGGLVSVENLTVYELLGFMAATPGKRREYARKQAELDLLVLGRLQEFEDMHRAEVAARARAGGLSR